VIAPQQPQDRRLGNAIQSNLTGMIAFNRLLFWQSGLTSRSAVENQPAATWRERFSGLRACSKYFPTANK
jgi:hypothetical protein